MSSPYPRATQLSLSQILPRTLQGGATGIRVMGLQGAWRVGLEISCEREAQIWFMGKWGWVDRPTSKPHNSGTNVLSLLTSLTSSQATDS